MPKSTTFIDSFASGLDELPGKKQRDPEALLAVLRRERRFSVFEATSTRALAETMTALVASGRLGIDPGTPYPWTRVVAIDGVDLD